FQVGQFYLRFDGEVEDALAYGAVDGGAGDVDVVDVAAAMQFDFVGHFNAVNRAVVVVVDFFVNAADGGGFLHDEMCLWVEERFAFYARGRGDFELQGVFSADLGVADEGQSQ